MKFGVGTTEMTLHGHLVQRGAGRLEDLLVGLLLGLAKLTINRSRQQVVEGAILADCPLLFCGYVRARVSLAKKHVMFTNTLDVFRERSSPGGDKKGRTGVSLILFPLELALMELNQCQGLLM
eukprot:g36413.t1